MKRIEKIGWIGKDVELEKLLHVRIENYVAGNRDPQWTWPLYDWPPRKVKITIEEVE